MQKIGPVGWGFWLAGLAYCNRNLTDGFIPWTKARTLCSFEIAEDDGHLWGLSRSSGFVGEDLTADWVIGLLLDAGLWEEVRGSLGRIDGYQIHDYPDYQPLKAQIEEERSKKVAAGQAGGIAAARARAIAESQQTDSTRSSKTIAKSNPKPKPKPKPKPNPVNPNQNEQQEQVVNSQRSGEKETPDEREYIPPIPIDSAKVKRGEAILGGFALFWSLYPRKEGRLKAERAWCALNDAQRTEALARLPDFIPEYSTRETRYVKLPTTWLNGHNWLDDPTPISSNGARAPNGPDWLKLARDMREQEAREAEGR